MTNKTCKTCGIPKDIDDFYKDAKRNVIFSSCKACCIKKNRERALLQPELTAAYQKAYQKYYQPEHRKYYLQREDVKERKRQYQREYYRKNRERLISESAIKRRQRTANTA